MKILITGAAGFIGSVCTARFLDRGHDVIAIDDLSRGLNDIESFPEYLKADCRDGIAHLLGKPKSYIVPDAVVHLAAGTGSLDRPIEQLRDLNVEMTKAVYQDSIRLGARAFVFPVTSLALTVPDSPYVQSKEEAMDWLMEQQNKSEPGSVPTLIPLRFFNVAGAYKGFTEKRKLEVHLIPGMVDCIQRRRPLTINGTDYETIDGTPSREFVNVVDVADFILYLIQRTRHNPFKRFDRPLQVGTGNPATVIQIVHEFNRFVSKNYNFGEQVLSTVDGPRRAFDCGVLHCEEQNMWFFKKPMSWRGSLRQEVKALLEWK